MLEIFRRLRAPLLAVVAVLVCAAPASAAIEMPAVAMPSNTGNALAVSPGTPLAQEFVAAYGGPASAITVWASRADGFSGPPAGSDLTISLLEAAPDGGPGAPLFQTTVPRDQVPVSQSPPTPLPIPLPGTFSLVRGKRYFVVLSTTGLNTFYYGWHVAGEPLDLFADPSVGTWSREGATGAWAKDPCITCGDLGVAVRVMATDIAPPTVSFTSPGDGEIIEFGTTVRAGYSCADDFGLASCEGSVADGALLNGAVGSHTLSVTARDTSGQTTTATRGYRVVDTTDPTIASEQHGETFELGADVPAKPTCADAAGIAEDGCVADPAVLDTTSVGTRTYTVTATDANGRTATGAITYSVTDTVAPAISIGAPAADVVVLLGADVATSFSCEDLAEHTCVGDARLDTTTVGAKTFAVAAEDASGNVGTASLEYRVVYDFAGWYAPVNAWPTQNVVKAGSTVPVKFSLGGDQGLAILAGGAPASVSLPCDSLGTEADAVETVTSQTGLTYDATSGRYQLNWKTRPEWAGQCRQFVLELADGTKHRAAFRLR